MRSSVFKAVKSVTKRPAFFWILAFALVLQNLQSTKRKCFFLFQKWFLTRKSVLISTLRTYLPMVVLC